MAPASWAAFTLCLPRQALGPSLMLPPDRLAALPGGTWRNLSRFGAAGLGGMHGAQGQADRAPQAAGVPEHSLGRGRPLVRWRLPPDVAQCLQHAGRVGHRRRPLLGTPTPSALFPMSPHSSSADGPWCSTRGWERLRPQVVIIEVSHQGSHLPVQDLPLPPGTPWACRSFVVSSQGFCWKYLWIFVPLSSVKTSLSGDGRAPSV